MGGSMGKEWRGGLEGGFTFLWDGVVKERCEFRSDGSQRPWSMVCLENQRILSFQLLTLVTRFGVVDRAVWRWARRMKKGKVGRSNMCLLRSCLNVRASRQARCAFSGNFVTPMIAP